MRSKLKKIIFFLLDPKIFFLLVAFLLIQLWFSKNLLLGGTEAGVPTYTPGKILDQIRWLWWEALGPGVSIPNVAASIPLYFLMSLLQWIGLEAIEIQKVLFFIIIYLQGLGASLVFRTILPKAGRLQLLAGLFYIFNPYMMISVWHRFIYANFILSATLPLFIYFYLQLLEQRKIKFIFLFLLTSFLSSFMFSSISPVIAVWLAICVLFLVALILNRNSFKKLVNIAFLTIALFIFWILANLWWIYPLINTGNLLSVFSSRGNVDTLITLSSQSTINFVIRGINPFVIFQEEDWGEIYATPLFQLLSWISFLLILIGLIKRDQGRKIWFMILLLLFGIFAAKGAAEPLGGVTAWFYANIFLLGAIRNPFEKLGLLVFLPASVLMTIGIATLWNLQRGIKRGIPLKIITIGLILGFGVYLWPMFSDKLFGSEKYPPFFTVPDDYSVVSAFLEESLKSDNGKVLHLPISEGDSATYKWQYTYNGVELAYQLFPGSSISRQLYVPFIDQLLKQTARVFHSPDYGNQRIVLSALGIKYIVLNKNLDWHSRGIDNPLYLENILALSPDLEVIFETENLKVYKFLQNTNSAVVGGENLTLISGNIETGGQFDYVLNKLLSEKGIFLKASRDKLIPKEAIASEIIFPTRVIDTRLESIESLNLIIPQPFVKHLPDRFYYPLIILKEKVEFLFTLPFEKPMKMEFFARKRLKETKLLKEQNKDEAFNQSLRRYAIYLSRAIKGIEELPDEELDITSKIILKVTSSEQKEILENFISQVTNKEIKKEIENNIEKIVKFRKLKGLESYYVYEDNKEVGNSYIYQFLLARQTNAEILLSTFNTQLLGLDFSLFLDGKLKELVATQKNSNRFSLGEIRLQPGIHEIALKVPSKEDQVQTGNFIKKEGIVEFDSNDDLIQMTSLKDNALVEYPILDYNPDKTYVLSFFYRVIRGATPQIQIWQGSRELNEYNQAKIKRNLSEDLYDFDWKYYEISISSNNNASQRLDRNATNPLIRIFIPFWNNCESKNFLNIKICKKQEVRNAYNKPTKVEIKDLRIREAFSGMIFLDSSLNNNLTAQSLNFKRISPVEYLVETEGNAPSLFISLNEGFHTGWQVFLNSTKEVVEEKNHFLTNGYANGWLINNPGKNTYRIKFIPQEYLYKGALVSLLTYIIVTILMVRQSLFGKDHNG